MGIKKLKQLISTRAPQALIQIPISVLSGKRIAIDGNNWVLLNLAICRKYYLEKLNLEMEDPDPVLLRNKCLIQLITFLLDWIDQGILPVIVFDGSAPIQKANTHAERKEQARKQKEDIAHLTQQVRSTDFPEQEIVESLRKALKQCNSLPYADMKFMQRVLQDLGFPVLFATTEAEKLCSMLCIEGQVGAVFSTDTDNLVYGAPLVLTGLAQSTFDEDGYRIRMVEGIRLDLVLEGLELSHAMFVDLCIMCGCDYNENIRGYGIQKSYALIQEYGYIHRLPSTIDTKVLNYRDCRAIFSYQPSSELIDPASSPLMLVPNPSILYPLLDQIGGTALAQRIAQAWNVPHVITEGYPEALDLIPPPKYSHRPIIRMVM